MGTWGYNIYENDTFCEVIELFKNRIGCGLDAENVATEIQHEYKDEVDACIASLAVAECLWRLGKITCKELNNVMRIIEEEIDNDYWVELDADEDFIHNRRLILNDFLARISNPPTKEQMWDNKPHEHALRKGSCFWYRYRGNLYGGVVLEIIKTVVSYYLVLISERIDSIPQEISHILATPVYTVAWFGDVNLLNSKRFHIIGEINLLRHYINKYGINIEPGQSVRITNCGQDYTWGHSFRQLSFDGAIMQDFLN